MEERKKEGEEPGRRVKETVDSAAVVSGKKRKTWPPRGWRSPTRGVWIDGCPRPAPSYDHNNLKKEITTP